MSPLVCRTMSVSHLLSQLGPWMVARSIGKSVGGKTRPMRLVIGINEAMRRLERLPFAGARQAALQSAGEQLERAVKASLSHVPGEDHATPWLRTGELRDSIGHESDSSSLVVGSLSQVAVDQELGTRLIPPRPFLSSTAAAEAEALVGAMSQAVVDTLKDQP